MKKIIFFKSLLLCSIFIVSNNCSNAQLLQKIKEKVQETTEDKAVDKSGRMTDSTLSKADTTTSRGVKSIFKSKKKTETTTPNSNSSNSTSSNNTPGIADNSNNNTTSSSDNTASLVAYQNYDFVPGDTVLFEDNFADDQVGEFPAHWLLGYGQGQVNSFDGKKVFMLTSGEHGDAATVLEPRLKKKSGYMPSAFTVEFDMYTPYKEGTDADIRSPWVGLTFYGTDDPINSYDDLDITPIQLGFYSSQLYEGAKELTEDIGGGNNFVNKWHHVAIAYRNKQMKIYLDQNRLYVIPEVKDPNINKFGIRVSGKCVVTNIRLAAGGGMNMIGKKFTDAKIVTHGINFDVDKATIKPESMGTLNMIVQIMKDNPEIKFEVDGHTDNTGSAAHNLTLSQQRADAVKAQLVNMGIDASRLTTKGFGDSKPISDNSTFDGKANNRRVEFVKM